MNIWVWSALLIVCVLAVAAIYYSYLWAMRKREIKANQDRELDLIRQKQKDAQNSINLIARALLQGQVSATEASLRIVHLLRVLVLDKDKMEVFNVFHKLSEETAHIPILDEWKKLSRKEQKEFDRLRLSIEEKYKDFTRVSAEKIVNSHFFEF